MKSWKLYCAALAPLALAAPAAWAQGLPAITPPANLAPVNPPVNAPAAPAAQPPNIWDMLCPRADQKAACKAKICNCPLGQLFNNMLAPAGAMTGGILGPCCPTINAADLAKPPDSAEGAAARLKADEADAAARRAAIRYMAGADCHYWPEVTEALIGALRSDRNECVRLEAALALGRGCCCNRATMLALTICVSGSTVDGNPSETSDRVKFAAMAALNHCLANFTEVVPAPPPAVGPMPPVTPEHPGEKVPVQPMPGPAMSQNHPSGPTEFYHHLAHLDEKQVVEDARHAVEHMTPIAATAPSPEADHSIFGIARAAMTTAPGPVVQTAATTDGPATDKPAGEGILPAMMNTPTASPPAPAVVPAVTPATPTAGVTPAGYNGQPSKAAPAVDKTSALPPARPTAVSPAAIANTVTILRESINPEEREKAADVLAVCDGWANPNVVQALVEAARSDSAPLVRAAALRSLTRMNVRTLPVKTVAEALKTDPDPRVRTEAEAAINQISGATHAQ